MVTELRKCWRTKFAYRGDVFFSGLISAAAPNRRRAIGMPRARTLNLPPWGVYDHFISCALFMLTCFSLCQHLLLFHSTVLETLWNQLSSADSLSCIFTSPVVWLALLHNAASSGFKNHHLGHASDISCDVRERDVTTSYACAAESPQR